MFPADARGGGALPSLFAGNFVERRSFPMRKRISALFLAMALGLTACGRNGTENPASADSSHDDRDVGITEDEALCTFPAVLFEIIGIDTDDYAAKEGEDWENVTVNANGSVSAVISKAEREEFLNTFEDAFERNLSRGTAVNTTDEEIPQRVGYTYRGNSFVIDIYAGAGSVDMFEIEDFFVYGILYQVYSGGEVLDVTVNVLDIRSGETLLTESVSGYLDYAERQKETAELAGMTPRPGMTAREVRDSAWGSPDKINRDTYSWGVKEQWVYDGRGYVYLEDGVVTSVSER